MALRLQEEWDERNNIRQRASDLFDLGIRLRRIGVNLRSKYDDIQREIIALSIEGGNIQTKTAILCGEGSELLAKGNKLKSQGEELQAEGDRLKAKADLVFLNAVMTVYGNIEMKWKNWHADKQSYECHLENGEVYIP